MGIRSIFISSNGDFFIIYVLHFLVLLMEDEGSHGSLKIPTLISENPGKLAPVCLYHHYTLSR